MKITFVLKGDFEILPPVLPRLLYFAQKNIECRLICTNISNSNRTLLESHGVDVYTTCHKRKLLGRRNKILDWSGFRRACKNILSKRLNNSDFLYICSADTALALGRFFMKTPYVFQSNELYDQLPLYKNGIKKYALNAKVFVVPEYCRANVCAFWYGLNKIPFVVPNIPYVLSRERNLPISDLKAREALVKLQNKRIVLYQGHISADRTLNSIAEALCQMNDDRFVLVLMGTDRSGAVKEICKRYKNTIHIPFVTPPMHLEITSHAHIAVLSYDRVSMNNIFCAPNKIYEYSCYGIPMIGNDIPGLRYTVQANHMGVCAAYEDIASIVAAFKKIDDNYDCYRMNANKFFDENYLGEYLDRLLNELMN